MSERYMLWRTDNNWISRMKGRMDYKVLLFLVSKENRKTDLITIDKTMKDELCVFFSSKPRSIQNTIKSLMDGGFLLKVGDDTYRANPTALSLGTIVAYRRKLKVWNRLNSINT